jgi:carbonic anhydrase/acetyltransferase-like protein (isoleucine patch superfamily)
MKKLLIFVGTRNKQSILNMIADLLGYDIVGILDSHYYGNTEFVENVPIIGDERWLLDPSNQQAQQWLRDCCFFPANWWNGDQHCDPAKPNLQQLRLDRISLLEQVGATMINLIHPASMPADASSKYSSLKLGTGIFIDYGVFLRCHHVSIGDYCSIYGPAVINANTYLDTNVCTGPNVSLYNCTVGKNSYIGVDSTRKFSHREILNENAHLMIGSNVSIWAGSEISKNIPDNSIYTHHGRILKKF